MSPNFLSPNLTYIWVLCLSLKPLRVLPSPLRVLFLIFELKFGPIGNALKDSLTYDMFETASEMFKNVFQIWFFLPSLIFTVLIREWAGG